jgi:hypothetical protein
MLIKQIRKDNGYSEMMATYNELPASFIYVINKYLTLDNIILTRRSPSLWIDMKGI